MDTREFLKDLVRSREDRSAPIHFAGRQDEIGLILSRAYRMGDDESAGLTVIVQGAPGVGKTALLNEVSKRFRDEAARRVALYMRSPWAKEDEPGTLRRLAGAMFGQTPDDFTTTSTTVKRGGVSALGRAELSLTSSKVPPDIRSWADFDEVYANRIADARRVLVVVDEGQLFEPDANRMLVRFHTQAAYPILLVIGGLGDTRDKLEDLGPSRVGGRSVMNIGALPAADAAEAVRETLAWTLERCTAPPVRWTRKQFDAWCVALAALSQGWPQHITCVIQGVWLALAGAHRLELSTENLDTSVAHGRRFFADYYARRLRASKVHPRVALAAHRALQANNGDLEASAVAEALSNSVAMLSDFDRESHRDEYGESMTACLRGMLHAGIIEIEPDGRYAGTPIPTLTGYLETLAN